MTTTLRALSVSLALSFACGDPEPPTRLDEPDASPQPDAPVASPDALPPAPLFTIGGTVSGLEGTGLVLRLGGADLAISANGPFQFGGSFPDLTPYAVTVAPSGQPADPPQICSVDAGSGAIAGADVTTIQITCVSARRAFVTSTSGTGDLASWPEAQGTPAVIGIGAGDRICQTRAAAAGLPGTYVAWLSDQTVDAYCHVQGLPGKKADNCGLEELPAAAGPWMRTDGAPFCSRIDACVAPGNVVYLPVAADETGAEVSSGSYFTGTDWEGAWHSAYDACGDWQNDEPGSRTVGSYTFDASWTASVASLCEVPHRLLCLETGPGIPLQLPQPTGRRMFMTSVRGKGQLGSWPDAGGKVGIAAGDAVCQARALAGNLPNPTRYKAWLSNYKYSATYRLSSDGPWVRVDGMPFAASKADLVDDSVLAAANVSELGTYLDDPGAFTGTLATGSSSGKTCGDWGSADPATVATSGRRTSLRGGWTGGPDWACNANMRLLCFED